jgi:hypothetical protein
MNFIVQKSVANQDWQEIPFVTDMRAEYSFQSQLRGAVETIFPVGTFWDIWDMVRPSIFSDRALPGSFGHAAPGAV